jgi:hypothetical protein
MPRRDTFHETVKRALIKEGWTITHDPFTIPFGPHRLYVDLGAERLLAAEKSGQRIAVEIKSFLSPSPVSDLESALGQYVLYRSLLARSESERALYLAVPVGAYQDLFSAPLGQVMIEDHRLKLIAFDPVQEVIEKWIG